MSSCINDRVVHIEIGREVTIVGFGKISNRALASCEWLDADGETRRSLYPENELSVAFYEAVDHNGTWYGNATRAAIKRARLECGNLVGWDSPSVAKDGWAFRAPGH